MMLTEIPSQAALESQMGSKAVSAWNQICNFIDENYDMEPSWDSGGKYGKYVLRFKKSGKTLCTLYVREERFGCWIILGQAERGRFEKARDDFSEEIRNIYDATPVYHDGKWVMLEVSDDHLVDDVEKMIRIKKRPNRQRESVV